MLGAVLVRRAVARGFEAMNRRDVEALIGMFHEDGVYEVPTATVVGGRHIGREAIRAWMQRWYERMPETTFTVRHVSVENIFALGATNTAHVEWDLDQADVEGHRYHLTGVTSFEITGGKARLVKDYIFEQELVASIWPPRPS